MGTEQLLGGGRLDIPDSRMRYDLCVSVTAEPRVVAEDVAAVVRRYLDKYPSVEAARQQMAEEVGCSTETVKRLTRGAWETIDLDLADRMLVVCGGHLSECTVLD